MTLDELKPGDSALIVKNNAAGALGQRLCDLGFFAGSAVDIVRNAPLVDPVELRLDGYTVSIRHNEARCIEVASK